MSSLRSVLLLLVILGSLSLESAVRLDHKKVRVSYEYLLRPNASSATAVTWYWRQPSATEPPALRAIATYSLEYKSYEVFEVAQEKLEKFLTQVRDIGFMHWDESASDYLSIGGEKINTRSPNPVDTKRGPRAKYSPDEYGLYLVNFVWYPQTDWWRKTFEDPQVVDVHYLYETGRVVGATPEAAARLYEMPWVQFVEPVHPYLKAKPEPIADPIQSIGINVARIPGRSAAVDRLRNLAVDGSFADIGGYIYGNFPVAAFPLILAEPTVWGTFPVGTSMVSSPPLGTPIPRGPAPATVPAMQPLALLGLAAVLAGAAYWMLSQKP